MRPYTLKCGELRGSLGTRDCSNSLVFAAVGRCNFEGTAIGHFGSLTMAFFTGVADRVQTFGWLFERAPVEKIGQAGPVAADRWSGASARDAPPGDFEGLIWRFIEMSPELAAALALALALPLLAGLGYALPRARPASSRIPSHDATSRSAQSNRDPATGAEVALREQNAVAILNRIGGGAAAAFRVPPGGLSVGSAADAGLMVDGPGCEPIHFLLVVDPAGTWQLVSLAGTEHASPHVNGRRVSRSPLAPGDTIRLGFHLWRFDLVCHGLDQLADDREAGTKGADFPVADTGSRSSGGLEGWQADKAEQDRAARSSVH